MARRLVTQKNIKLLIGLIIAIASLIAAQPDVRDKITEAAVTNQPGLYTVTQFTDGDTIAVNMNGKTEKVRFIGVDTPETHKPNTPVQCFGPQAAAFTKQFIGTNQVRLTADPLNTDRDRYDRLLRYVSLPDGTVVNAELIKQGYGFYYPYFPFSRKAEFAGYGAKAQADKVGLWNVCQPTKTDGGGYISNNAV